MAKAKRVFRIKCPPRKCEQLLERIEEVVSVTGDVEARLLEGAIELRFYGYESEIKASWQKLRALLSGIGMAPASGPRRFSIDYLVKRVGSTFPPRVLKKVLEKSGFFAEVDSSAGVILTSASEEEVVKAAARVAEAHRAAGERVRGTSARYYVAALSAITGRAVEEVIERAVELGHMSKGEDGRAILRIEWQRGVDSFLRAEANRGNQPSSG